MAAVDVRQRDAFKKRLPRFFQYLALSIVTLIILVPIVIMVFGALKTRGEMFAHPYTPPIPAHWENFGQILTTASFWTLLRNSLIVTLATTFGVVAASSLAAFVFARMHFRGKEVAFNFLLLGLMFPITVAIMPVYLVIRQMHLIDPFVAVILVETAFVSNAQEEARLTDPAYQEQTAEGIMEGIRGYITSLK